MFCSSTEKMPIGFVLIINNVVTTHMMINDISVKFFISDTFEMKVFWVFKETEELLLIITCLFAK